VFSGILRRILGLFPELIGAAILLVWSFPLTMNPSLHVDEGYYLGAARTLLDGDIFLRTYSFDKPFMVAIWPLPGMLLFGINSFGFKLTAWLSYGLSFVLFAKVLQKVLGNRVLSDLVAAILFSVPTFFVHGVSNFCEPFLILCSVLLFYGLTTGASIVFLSRVFFLGFFTKYSFALYFPLLLPLVRKVGFRAFLRPSVGILGLALVYWISNPIKFGSLTWFSHFVLDRHDDPFFVRTWKRAVSIFQSLDSKVLSFLLLTGMVGWWSRSKSMFRSESILLPIVVAIHLVIYLFMGAHFYPRYVVQSLPAIFLLAVHGLATVRGGSVRSRLIDPALIIALLVLLVSVARNDRQPVDQDRELGRELHLYGSEANHEGAWVQNAYLWQSAPFGGKSSNEGCLDPVCSERVRTVHPQFEKGYRFQDGKLRRMPLWAGTPSRVSLEEVWLRMSPESLATKVLDALRLKKTYQVGRVDLDSHQVPDSGAIFLPRGIRLLAHPLPGKMLLLPEIEIRFTLGIHEFHQGAGFPRPIYQLLARVEALRIGGVDFLDGVMPLFFGGYVIPIEILPFVYDPKVRFSPIEIRADGVRILKESIRPSS